MNKYVFTPHPVFKQDHPVPVTKSIRLLGKEIFRIERDDVRKKVFVFGKKVYSKRYPVSDWLKAFCENGFRMLYNHARYAENRDQLDRMRSGKGKRILYVTDSLESVGGVETRLVKQINYLRFSMWECALLTQENVFLPSLGFVNVHLDFHSPNFSDCLVDIARRGNFDFVEFQCKASEYIHHVDLCLLKCFCKVGLAIHGIIKIDQMLVDQMDYCFFASSYLNGLLGLATGSGHPFPVIRNWVDSITPKWSFSGQNRALFISRVDDEKFPTLKSFLWICKKIGCDYEIAGNISKSSKMGDFIRKMEYNRFIGTVDTVRFLERHANDYLFVGGVGQVPLEALSFGIPALVATHHEDYEYSRFVVRDNFDRLASNNFVIRHFLPDDTAGHFEQFIHDRSTGNLDRYTDTTLLYARCTVESAMRQYMALLDKA